MSVPNPDTTAAKVESSTENGNTNVAPQNTEGGNTNNANQHQQYGGGPGGGGGGFIRRGGNRFTGGYRRPPNMNMKGGPGGEQHEFFGRKRMGRGGHQGGGGGGGGMMGNPGLREQGGPPIRSPDERLNDRINQISGPTYDIPPLDSTEKKFSGRARLYIGNIAADVTEDEINELFKRYGETSELFMNKEKNFGFIRLDFHVNAEKAKRELDGTVVKGRTLKIRFAPNGSSIKVKNLVPFVSNELLHYAFSVFGEIERCIVIVDDHGKPTGEGIVEYARKGSASLAIRKCSEGCFFLTASLRPVIVEQYDAVDETDGHPDKNIPKKNPEYNKVREIGPRFANPNSFEHEYGMRWKQLHELYAQKEQALHKELEMEKEKLEAQMEYAKYEHETEMLREQLRARELDRDRQKREWEMKERQAEETRQRNEDQMRRQQEDLQARIILQDEELRRRQQENNLFMQAHQLDNMLDQQEQAFEQPERVMFNSNINNDIGPSGNSNMEPKPFMNAYERNNHRFEGPRGGGNLGGRGHWSNENRGGNRDDFSNKRRRY
ncbi:hypothetical protein FQR65_LT08307 [Abscondita terminalis]|nr:hypothetical protein FQR65_LT08307 [Abscondita terminalis]